MNISKSIGVFDSGMGGISVLGDLIEKMPEENFIYYGDSANAPYGEKSKSDVRKLTIAACDFLISKGVKAIVIACNTATSASIVELREKYDIPIIGMEPAIKPAIEDDAHKTIAVMATDLTLKEDKFNVLVETLSGEEDIIRVPCPEIVKLVEEGIIDGDRMEDVIEACFTRAKAKDFGSVVLGCTHYLFVKNVIERVFPNTDIYHGNYGTVNRVSQLLKERNELKTVKAGGLKNCRIYSSSDDHYMIKRMLKLLNKYLIS